MQINFDKLPKIIKPGLAVDIDETLSNTIEHLVSQLQSNFGNPENLTTKELIEKYRYTQNVPYWQSDEALTWIDKEIHSNELQKELPLIETSNIYLNKIAEKIPIATYLTIRPEAVAEGTQDWLDQHNFPKAPIISKPMNIAHQDGNQWKAKILEELYPDIQGIIDDNAKLLKYLSKDYKGAIFLYDHKTTDSKLNVIPCQNWVSVYSEIKKYYR